MALLERTGRKETARTGNGRGKDSEIKTDGLGRFSGRTQIPGTVGRNDAGD